MKKIVQLGLLMGTLFFSEFAFSNNINSISFFASNNTSEITMQTALTRLTGPEQHELQNSIINTLQLHHIEQGKFEDILGMYCMSNDKNITADNTEHFTSSPYQHLSNNTVFTIAKELAVTLKQDSVAVFIPNKQEMIADISVSFSSKQPSIPELINLIHEKLPASYSQAFSLHLNHDHAGFNNVTVSEIEWLGSKINLADIKKAFPDQKISEENGNVYLVFKDGKKQKL